MRKTSRPLAWKVTAVVLGGATLGVAAAAADESVGLGTSDFVRVLSWLPNIGSVWVATAFLAGAWFRRPRSSIAAGCAALVGAVVAYYTFGLTLGDRTDVGLAAIGPTLLLWLVAALIAGPVLGYLGFVFRCGGKGTSLLGSLALPAIIVAEAGYLLAPALPYFGNDPWRDGLLIVMLGVGVLLVTIFIRRWKTKWTQPSV